MKKKGPAPRGSSVCLSFDLCRYRSAVQTPDTGTSATMHTLCMHVSTQLLSQAQNISHNYQFRFIFSFTKRLKCFIIEFILFNYVNQHIKSNPHIWLRLKLLLAILWFGSSGTASPSLSESASSGRRSCVCQSLSAWVVRWQRSSCSELLHLPASATFPAGNHFLLLCCFHFLPGWSRLPCWALAVASPSTQMTLYYSTD